jgi:DNA-damage-inducible protein D
MEQDLVPFLNGKEVSYVIFEDEKWFSIVDIIEILTESNNPSSYWRMFKHVLLEDYDGIPFWKRLKMQSKQGKMKGTDCANTAGVLRIVMSIPSPKAEPLKMWLCEQGMNSIKES